MPFQPFRIPFTDGLHQDTTNYDADRPQYLLMADNVIFTKKGSLLGRPGVVSEDAVIQNTINSGGAAIQNSTLLSTTVNNLIPCGIESSDKGIIALYQGSSYIKSNTPYSGSTPWRGAGPIWSTKKYVSPFLDYRNIRFPDQIGTGITTYNNIITSDFSQTNLGGLNITAQTAVGASLTSVPVTSGSSLSLPVVGQINVDLLDTQTLTNYDITARCNACICTASGQDVIVYPNAAGGLFVHKVQPATVPGLGTETQIATNGSVFIQPNVAQTVWCCAGAVGTSEVYIAYVASSTTITVLRVNTSISAATVTATFTFTAGTVGHGVSLCSNGLGVGTARLCVGWMDTSATNRYTTKILLVNSISSITDASINVQHGVGQESTPIYRGHTVGLTHVGTIAVCYVTNTAAPRKTNIDVRSFSSVTSFTAYSLFDGWDTAANAAGPPNLTLYFQSEWKPFIPASNFCNRTVVGVYKETNSAAGYKGGIELAPVPSSQWFIIDISSNLSAAAIGTPIVVAHSSFLSNYTTPPVNPSIINASIYSFGVVYGVDFDDFGIVNGGAQVVKLQSIGARSCIVNGEILFTNSTMYSYDGIQMAPLGFVEEAPQITGISIFTPTGIGSPTPVSGSVSLQAIWEITNGRGQVVRSAQSIKITTPRALVNEAISLTVSSPQLCGRYLTPGSRLVIKVFSTIPNPPANAPLYLVSSNDINIINGVPSTGTSSWGPGGLVNHNSVSTIQVPPTTPDAEQLYTGGGVFDDQMPPSSDRGIAFINNRVWTADYNNVYVSKLLTNQFGVAFNLNSDKLIIPMPTSIGEIQALGELADKVAVIGTLGTAYIYGAGFDDLGNGTGWLVQTTSEIGAVYSNNIQNQLGPRLAVNIPSVGVMFLSNASDVYLMDFSGNTQIVSRQTIDKILPLTELTYWTAGLLSNTSHINHGAYLVGTGFNFKLMDLESNRWATWSPSIAQNVLYTTSFNGKLWLQGTDNIFGSSVFSFTGESGQDLGVNYQMVVQHNSVSITGQLDNGMVNAWGRLRSLTVLGTSPSLNPYNLTVQVQADKSLSNILNKSITINPTSESNWPFTNWPEFRTTIQRCGSFITTITAVPAIVELAGIECWATVTGDRNPSRNRL